MRALSTPTTLEHAVIAARTPAVVERWAEALIRSHPAGSPPVTIWEHQRRIAHELATWAGVSIVAGGALAVIGHTTRSRAVRAFGAQTAAWGAIDLAIAGLGELRRRGRLATAEDPHGPGTIDTERRQLRRVLLVNAGLDVGYIVGGAAGVASGLRRADGADRLPATVGHSAAVIGQGAFLLAFDAWHARALGGAAG